MATFDANPDDSHEPWIEKSALEGYRFRIWHIMFFSFSAFVTLVILICCCVRVRIPRTRQEIEGDYKRKKLAEKFQERLRVIQSCTNIDAIDLEQALKIIQEDVDQENRKLREKSLEVDAEKCGDKPNFARKFAAIMLATKLRPAAAAEKV